MSEPVPNIAEPITTIADPTKVTQRWWKWFQQISNTLGGGGTYEPAFESGSIQVLGPNGTITGYGGLQYGFLLPNPSGTPSEGILVGGAGITQVVYITDEQIPGQKGITVIRSAGDASSTSPATDDGGDLLDFAGGTLHGSGGTAKYQGGTSVSGRAGDAVLHGGNSTTGIPGNAVCIGGETGTTQGAGVILIMTRPTGSATFGEVAIHSGDGALPGGSTVVLIEFLSNGEFFLTNSGTGAGNVGDSFISGGLGAPAKWATDGKSTSFVVGAHTYTFTDGRLTNVV